MRVIICLAMLGAGWFAYITYTEHLEIQQVRAEMEANKREHKLKLLAIQWADPLNGRGLDFWEQELEGASDEKVLDLAYQYGHEPPYWIIYRK